MSLLKDFWLTLSLYASNFLFNLQDKVSIKFIDAIVRPFYVKNTLKTVQVSSFVMNVLSGRQSILGLQVSFSIKILRFYIADSILFRWTQQ